MKNCKSLGPKQYFSHVMPFYDCTFLDCGFESMNPKQWCFGGTDSMRNGASTKPVSCIWPVRFRRGLSTSKEDESRTLTTPFAFALKHIHFFGCIVEVIQTPWQLLSHTVLRLLDQFPSLYPSYAIQICKRRRKLILYLEHKCLNQNKGE